MMAQLRKAFIKGGVTVPQTHNDMGMWWNYNDGTGSPDLYGFDDYPVGVFLLMIRVTYQSTPAARIRLLASI